MYFGYGAPPFNSKLRYVYMKNRLFVLNVLVTVVITGMFIWFSSNHNVQNKDFTIPFFLSILFALGFGILTELQLIKIIAATTIGALIALIIKIIIDWQFDPTSHNLFPFEIVIDSIAFSIASSIGAAIGFIYRRFIKRKLLGNK